jgi:cyclopropane fatty-acyl-phospholipid synthase-like methyltransferase
MGFLKRISKILYYFKDNCCCNYKALVFLLNSLKQSILWINRRNENDIVDLYNSITPFVQLALGEANNQMLNFGYWTDGTSSPLEAQIQLCRLVGEFAELQSAKRVIDVGSGFSAPAVLWNFRYKNNNFLDIICVDINLKQLSHAVEKIRLPIATITRADLFYQMVNTNIGCKPTGVNSTSISLVNATAMSLPFADNCVDRIIALESAQHFKPLSRFLRECKRVLTPEGLLVVAIPIIGRNSSHKTLLQFANLGILYFTWASEHYYLDRIKSAMRAEDFQIREIQHIGHHVYEPCADYYIHNRRLIKQRLKTKILSHAKSMLIECVERIIYISALKMKDSSQKEIIDYVLIKAAAVE